MAVPTHTPIPIKEFRGLLILPDKTNVPPEFASAIKNAAFLPGSVLSRPGTSQRINLGGGTDVFHMEIALLTLRYHLLLMDGPGLYVSKNYGPRLALKTSGLTGVNHFRKANFGTRTFFTFSDTDGGLTPPFVWTSQGASDFFDPATEAAPTVGTFAAVDGVAGSVTAGIHKLVVIYETRSGYQTSPSASISFTAAGAKKVNLSNIPIGPATVTKRHIGMTKAAGATYYLLGTVADNTSTSATFDVADATLIQQTNLSNWFQFKHPLPNMKGVMHYRGRMVYWHDSTDGNLLWISEKGLPATVRSDIGFRSVAPEDGDGISNCIEMGEVLYIFKSRSIWAMQDNGDDPAFWAEPRLICPWAGTWPSGIARTTDKQECFFLDVKGIYHFNGGDPIMISQAIQPYFEEESTIVTPINHSSIHRSELHFNPQDKEILAWVPTGSATLPNLLLVGDVREGLDRIKWTTRETAGTAWRSFAVDSIEVDIAEAGPIVSRFDDTVITDRGTAIDWYYQPGALQPRSFGMNLLSGLTIQAVGSGDLNITVYNQDEISLATPTPFALSATPSKDFFRRLNSRSERLFVRLGQNNAAAKAKISSTTPYMIESGIRAA